MKRKQGPSWECFQIRNLLRSIWDCNIARHQRVITIYVRLARKKTYSVADIHTAQPLTLNLLGFSNILKELLIPRSWCQNKQKHYHKKLALVFFLQKHLFCPLCKLKLLMGLAAVLHLPLARTKTAECVRGYKSSNGHKQNQNWKTQLLISRRAWEVKL